MDRLARSKQLYTIHDDLEKKGVNFVSLSESIDTTTDAGSAIFGMIAIFAEFERNLIQERQEPAWNQLERGRTGGRALSKMQKKAIASLMEEGARAVDVAKEYGRGRGTVYKVLMEFGERA